MEVVFSNTIRSLEAGRLQFPIITLLLAILLLVVWDVWFFFGTVPQTEISPIVRVDRDGGIVTIVPDSFLEHIDYGEPVIVHIDGEPRTIRATVVGGDLAKRSLRIKVNDDSLFFPPGTTGQVEFAIDYTTPVSMLLESAGLK